MVDVETKEALRVRALLQEYSEVRSESRTFEILAIVSIILSVLTFIGMIFAAFLVHEHVLFFISLPISIFFLLVSMSILVYITNLGLRASQIEEHLDKILGEPTVQWESNVGIFGAMGSDFIISKLGKYWVKFSFLSVVAFVGAEILSVIYMYETFYDTVGTSIWYYVGFTIALLIASIFFSYRFYTRDWEKIKID